MIIQHNIAALNSHRQLSINNSSTSKNLEKLSSGYRINRAGDDAAGLAISEKMRGQIRGLAKAEENTSHAINLIQTAEGGLQETHAILQRMRELAVQSANGTYDNPNDRMNLQKEFERLTEEIDRIADATHYNGIQLLDGSKSDTVSTGTTKTVTDVYLGSIALDAANTNLGGKDFLQTGDSVSIELTYSNGTFKGTGEFVDGGSGSDTTGVNVSVNTVGGTTTVSVELSDGSAGDKLTFTFEIDADEFDEGATLNLVFDADTTTNDPPAGLNAVGNSYASRYASDGRGMTFQIGANGTADQQMGLFIERMHAAFLGDGTTNVTQTSIDLQDHANDAIEVINAAINQVSAQRAELGAAQNRLEHTLNNLGVTKENLTSAESTIRDVDMAKEMMEYTKNSILVQASQAMLAQAQSLPQGVLQLLR